MSLLAIKLDRGAAGHLALAIYDHRKALERVGSPCPTVLVELQDLAVSIGQGTPPRATSLTPGAVAPQDPTHEVVSHREVAARLGVSLRSVGRLLDRGELAHVVIGGRRKVRRIDLDSLGATSAGGSGDQADERGPLSGHARPSTDRAEDT